MKSKSNGEDKSGAHDQGYLSAEELIIEKQKQKKQSSDKTEEKK